METWAHCRSCDRWYYCARDIDLDGDHPCPVCCAPPDRVEARPKAEFAAITFD